ncbi:MAG: trimeric intracellular cation channel family protein [Proteobacteria bacterium]|nr:trimeric intracellular cation channel family protein [Pseudomonadota bacterium]
MFPADTLLLILSFAAYIAQAMTAALAAGRRTMDWVGVALLGAITALGGGSLRDVLLGHYPLSWVHDPYLLGLTSGAALLTIALARVVHHFRLMFLVLDAIGLVVFSILGCDVAIKLGEPIVIVVVAGMITGCAGGVLRDVLCNDVPLLFRSELYASVSVVTSAIYVGGQVSGVAHAIVTLVAFAAGLTFRLLAIRFKWEMPKFVYDRDAH